MNRTVLLVIGRCDPCLNMQTLVSSGPFVCDHPDLSGGPVPLEDQRERRILRWCPRLDTPETSPIDRPHLLRWLETFHEGFPGELREQLLWRLRMGLFRYPPPQSHHNLCLEARA